MGVAMNHQAPKYVRALAVLLMVGVAVGGCGGAPPAAVQASRVASDSGLLVDTATVDVPRAFIGQVFVEHDVVVAARAAGVIDSLFVNLGSRVQTNAPLAAIERQGQEIEHDRAVAALDHAQRALTRSRELGKSGGVTTADSEQVEAVYRDAALTLRKSQRDVELTRVTAPFAGIVSARYAKPKQLVAVGDTLFRVAETAPQLIRIRVVDPLAKQVRVGDRATIVGASSSVRTDARVVFTAPAYDAASGTREVILQASTPSFLPGESVTAQLGRERRRAIVAPRTAIAADGFALVLEGGRTTLRPVSTGADVAGNRVEILSGLAAGDRLAVPRR